ncbi:MAG: bifunctional enoyl-CoA hydratase/phosphate acetyltransferase [Eubacteriales bacterium]
MIKNLNSLMEHVRLNKKKTIAVAVAEDSEILQVVDQSRKYQLAEFILVGNKTEICRIMEECDITIECKIVNEPDHKRAAEQAVELVVDGHVDGIMKGSMHTSVFLKAVLNKEKGINAGKLISQVSLFDKEMDDGLQLLTDCAMAIQPTLDEKKQIIENAVELAISIGYDYPKVALLSALEVVNSAIPDTIEAAALSKMGDRGQIKNAIIDGPFALDNAISIEAAKHKGISGEVAGKADILVVPNLQVGNILTKALTFYAHKDVASAVIGAKVPIILTSRTDSIKNKLLSIALASYIS